MLGLLTSKNDPTDMNLSRWHLVKTASLTELNNSYTSNNDTARQNVNANDDVRTRSLHVPVKSTHARTHARMSFIYR
jgi:hypothetical protein